MKELKDNRGYYAIGCALLVLAGVGLGVLPLNRSLSETKKQAQGKVAQAVSLEKKVDILKAIQKGLNADQKRKQQLEIAAPVDSKIDEIFIMLETMATESGVEIENIQPGKASASVKNGLSEMTVTLKGEFNNLINFSKLVKGNVRPMFVKSVTFVAQESKDGKVTLRATFVLNILTATENASAKTETADKTAATPAAGD